MRLLVKLLLFGGIWLLNLPTTPAQRHFYHNFSFSRADSLRGALRPERTCYDVTFYELDVAIDPEKEKIDGFVDIHFQTLEDFRRLQIDLFSNMELDKVEFQSKSLPYTREFNAVFIEFPLQKAGSQGVFRVYYHGKPVVATNPPWDGGFIWTTDQQNRPWIAVACEGDGASLWWPNKDHLSDEPDSMAIRITVPDPLVCISNGNLRQTLSPKKGHTRYEWFVSYPINNYNVTVNIGQYAHFSDTYKAKDGEELALDYYVLTYNEGIARKHFEQVKPTLACFERFFGKYPFWDDGFALVETPYLGMEHQSAIAYGNGYRRGYLGGMIPRDMNWDYIIVHETGHEYFGNSISCRDLSEMWIHESFTTYMEALFVECSYSYADAVRYLRGQRGYIANQQPILGPYSVNWEDWDHSDHYYKGAWVLHTLRHAIGEDTLWFELLMDFYTTYAYHNITTQEFIDFVNERTGKNWDAFFEQYLWHPKLPKLLYQVEQQGADLKVDFRWKADVPTFNMPVQLGKPGAYQTVYPVTDQYQSILLEKTSAKDFQVAQELFLIDSDRK